MIRTTIKTTLVRKTMAGTTMMMTTLVMVIECLSLCTIVHPIITFC